VSKTEREKWGQMIETYLTQRDQLRGVISLVDARHAPTEDDIQMYRWLAYYELPTLIVATKSDKIARGKWNQAVSQIKKSLELPNTDNIVMFSAPKKMGKDAVWNWIEAQAFGGE
ncbi:YihA family ribosome biogenesis GTP-binding protein, partial [Levilactobacillus brevis]